jgi:hypothetical protein
LVRARPGEPRHKRAGPPTAPARREAHQSALCVLNQGTRRINLAAKAPEPARKTNAPTDSNGARGTPPVSGNSCDGAAVALLVALAAEALAEALADGVADGVADALAVGLVGALGEALDIAVEEGLAIMLSFIPIPCIPPEPIPPDFIP